jgi:hypothetical protein
MCDYQGYEFGAPYPDSVCIDGMLWDADSGNPGEDLTSGGDIPCRQCNWLAFVEWIEDEYAWRRLKVRAGIWLRHLTGRCPGWCPICYRAPLRFLRRWSRENQSREGETR